MKKNIEILNKIYEKENLSINESKFIFDEIMNGKTSDIFISSFLTALKN